MVYDGSMVDVQSDEGNGQSMSSQTYIFTVKTLLEHIPLSYENGASIVDILS